MISLATIFLILSQNWVGVWDIEIPEAVEPGAHLVIHSQERVELFNPDWLPYVVISSHFQGEEFEIHATFESRGDIIVLKGHRQGDRLSGHAEYRGKLPQYTLQQEMNGKRRLSEPLPAPVEWLAALRKDQNDQVIDILDVVLKKGKGASLSDFRRLWNDEIRRQYYYFLSEWSQEMGTLEKLHDAVKNSDKWIEPSDSSSLLQKYDAHYLVLIPSASDRQPSLIELPTALNEFPGGRRPC
ncbi:MAG TPA: hypothetical protein VKZ59_16190, partial [Acidobacteriota bacterium]|nr:hypothetical protein [Acidobacteriota bacterium]